MPKPETIIRNAICDYLAARGWVTQVTHGSVYQSGLPDVLAGHAAYGPRFIDAKVSGRYSFTPAQRGKWPLWSRNGIGIWIMTAANQTEYDKLFAPPNWRDYWKDSWGDPFNPPDPLEIANGH